MSLSARFATADDASAIVALFSLPHARDFVHAPSEDDVRGALPKLTYESWVVERDGEIVGFMLLGNDYGGWLWDVRTVVAKYQRHGIGAFVIRHAIARAFESGAHRLFLEVVERNAGACSLYEALGFTREGCYRDGYRNDDGTFENLIPYGLLKPEAS